MFTKQRFDNWPINQSIISGLTELGWELATQVQKDTIPTALEGNDDKANKIATLAQPIIDLLFVQGNPGGIKAVLHQRGLIENQLRLPLIPVSESVTSKLRTYVDQYD